jgi:hypothetical protein
MKQTDRRWSYIDNSPYNEQCFKKIWKENQNTFYVQWTFFSSENRAVYDVEKYGTAWQAAEGNVTCALHAGYLRL